MGKFTLNDLKELKKILSIRKSRRRQKRFDSLVKKFGISQPQSEEAVAINKTPTASFYQKGTSLNPYPTLGSQSFLYPQLTQGSSQEADTGRFKQIQDTLSRQDEAINFLLTPKSFFIKDKELPSLEARLPSVEGSKSQTFDVDELDNIGMFPTEPKTFVSQENKMEKEFMPNFSNTSRDIPINTLASIFPEDDEEIQTQENPLFTLKKPDDLQDETQKEIDFIPPQATDIEASAEESDFPTIKKIRKTRLTPLRQSKEPKTPKTPKEIKLKTKPMDEIFQEMNIKKEFNIQKIPRENIIEAINNYRYQNKLKLLPRKTSKPEAISIYNAMPTEFQFYNEDDL